MSELNRRIRERRDALGLTLEEVGRIVQVSKSTVLGWETGKIKQMRRDKLAALALALNTSIEYLMGLTNDPERHGYVLTPLEIQSFSEARRSEIFDNLLMQAGFVVTVDEDANVMLYDKDTVVNCTPEFKETVIQQVIQYFTFLLKQEGTPRKK